ncbi:MAG TPA: hypothetical protein PLU50_08965, partial [Pseudobdellovibrionaceae bacterium]|nr:hypothetical protein [Pseudobdellovibrionaceae bacterium]
MSRFNLLSTLGVVLLFFSQNAAFATSASDRGINIQSFVKRPDGTPVNLASATVNVKIYSQNDCILLDEDHPATAITNGFVYVVLGRGTSSTHDYGLSLAEALDNSTPRTGLDKITGGTANCNY